MSHSLFSVLICACTPFMCATANEPIAINQQVDSIVVIKHTHIMEVYGQGQLLASFHVSLGPNPVGAKHFRNDGKTPEGMYFIDGKNPNSHYHKCLGVSYPSLQDMLYAQQAGKPAGGDIKIHGLPNGDGHRAKQYSAQDWTLGCIALTDDEIDALFTHTPVGARVNILP